VFGDLRAAPTANDNSGRAFHDDHRTRTPALSSRALRGGRRTAWIAGGALALFALAVVEAQRHA
jgi:hypothetical protein